MIWECPNLQNVAKPTLNFSLFISIHTSKYCTTITNHTQNTHLAFKKILKFSYYQDLTTFSIQHCALIISSFCQVKWLSPLKLHYNFSKLSKA